jgi:hypothetical protein
MGRRAFIVIALFGLAVASGYLLWDYLEVNRIPGRFTEVDYARIELGATREQIQAVLGLPIMACSDDELVLTERVTEKVGDQVVEDNWWVDDNLGICVFFDAQGVSQEKRLYSVNHGNHGLFHRFRRWATMWF